MPITLSAKKKLRQDKKQAYYNRKVENEFTDAIKKTRRNPTNKNLTTAYSAIDQGVKKHLLHKNKAARLKSRLAKRTQISMTRTQKEKQ